MIESINKVEIAEPDEDGEVSWDAEVMLTVKNHRRHKLFAVLELPDGKTWVVAAKELIAALENATNVGDP